MAQDEKLTRELRAVMTADVRTALGELAGPPTAEQVLEAMRASAETLEATFHVRVEQDVQRLSRCNVTVVIEPD
jgi:hypothetical protein